jgi:transcriptional regulator with XRE-family HTH domain
VGGKISATIYQRVGQRMQQARQGSRGGKGYTQQEVASLLDVSPITLSRWETGTRNPSFEVLERFGQIVEKPLSFFFEEEPQEDEYAQMLLRITNQLDQTEKEDILAYARFRYERWYNNLKNED